MVKTAVRNAVLTVTLSEVVTGLQESVTEVVNQDGQGSLVIRVGMIYQQSELSFVCIYIFRQTFVDRRLCRLVHKPCHESR